MPVLLALLLTTAAHAHHGLDFLLLQDTSVPAPMKGSFFDNSEWTRESKADEFATEPGLYFGVAPGIGLGVTSHFADMGDGWTYSATMPFAVVNLLPPDKIPGLHIALWAGYEFAAEEQGHTTTAAASSKKRSRKTSSPTIQSSLIGSSASPKPCPKSQSNIEPVPQSTRTTKHNTGGTPCGPAAGPDAPPCPATHDHAVAATESTTATTTETVAAPVIPVAPEHVHEGIHRHGESGLHARLIIEADLTGRDKLVMNLINFTPAEGTGAWGYGCGIRHAFRHEFAMSLEALGDFKTRLEHQVLIAAHFTPAHTLTFKLGVGVGLTPDAPDVAVHTGIVWRF